MTSYIIRRVLLIIPTVFLALSFLFFLFFMLPGDPATLIAGGSNRTVDEGVIERGRRALRPRRPAARAVRQLLAAHAPGRPRRVLRESPQRQRHPRENARPQASGSAFWAIFIEIIVGISVGVLSAIRRYSWQDKLTTIFTSAASAIPVVRARIPPHMGVRGVPEPARLGSRLGADEDVWHRPQHVGARRHPHWRPVALSRAACGHPRVRLDRALAARMTRGSMLEVLGADYMRTALRERLARAVRCITRTACATRCCRSSR